MQAKMKRASESTVTCERHQPMNVSRNGDGNGRQTGLILNNVRVRMLFINGRALVGVLHNGDYTTQSRYARSRLIS